MPVHSRACSAKHQPPQSRVQIKGVDVNASEAVQDTQRGEEGARGRRLETGGVVRVQQLLSHMVCPKCRRQDVLQGGGGGLATERVGEEKQKGQPRLSEQAHECTQPPQVTRLDPHEGREEGMR
jgi:hypothetical protein